MVKLCKDCKHCREKEGRSGEDFNTCEKPMPRISLSTGRHTLQPYKYCETLRNQGFLAARVLGVCGSEGRWWETK